MMTKLQLTLVLSTLSLAAVALPTDLAPADGAVVPTHTDRQHAYLALPRAEREVCFAQATFRKEMAKADLGQGQAWWPRPTTLTWKGTGGRPCRVELRKAGSDRLVFATNAVLSSVSVRNLEIAAEYVWSVDDGEGRAEATFATASEPPRLLAVPHVPNVRDFGGHIGLGKRRVRQGLVFRSAGLNNNADDVYAPNRAAIAAMDTHKACATLERQYGQLEADWRELTANPTALTFVSARFPSEWRVMRAPNMSPFEAKSRLVCLLPTEYGETAAAGADGRVNLHGIGSGCAILESSLQAEADGYVLLGCGADWYWALSVNGTMLRDKMNRGNGIHPVSAENHTVCARVRKGDNIIRVYLGAGSGGFVWCCAPAKPVSRDRVLADETAAAGSLSKGLYHVLTGRTAGKTRIHNDNRATWLEEFGIKTDIDLRSGRETYGMTGSPLGDTVAWEHIPYVAYAGIGDERGREKFATLFRIFLNPAKYPIDFHCIAGQDRTGSLAFLLNGLLGVSDDDKAKDWEATGFWNSKWDFNHEKRYNHLEKAMEQYPGETMNARIYAYALACGITEDEIARFRSFMLEPAN